MANKLFDLQDAVNMQLAPLRVLEFHLSDFIEQIKLSHGGFKDELFTMCDALHVGLDNIEKIINNGEATDEKKNK